MAWGPHLAHHLVLYGLQAKNGFSIFKLIEKEPQKSISWLVKKEKAIINTQKLVFINKKVLWEAHSILLQFMYYWRCFPMMKIELGQLQQRSGRPQAQNVCRLALLAWSLICRLRLRIISLLLCQTVCVLSVICDDLLSGDWSSASFDWLCLMSNSSCELRRVQFPQVSGGSFPGLSRFPHRVSWSSWSLRGGSRAISHFLCTTLYHSWYWCLYTWATLTCFPFLDSPQSGRLLGATWDPPSPRRPAWDSQASDLELSSSHFVSQISGSRPSFPDICILKLLFCIFCLWFFAVLFVFSLFGPEVICSLSALCESRI